MRILGKKFSMGRLRKARPETPPQRPPPTKTHKRLLSLPLELGVVDISRETDHNLPGSSSNEDSPVTEMAKSVPKGKKDKSRHPRSSADSASSLGAVAVERSILLSSPMVEVEHRAVQNDEHPKYDLGRSIKPPHLVATTFGRAYEATGAIPHSAPVQGTFYHSGTLSKSGSHGFF